MGYLGDSSQLKIYLLAKFTSSRGDPAGQNKQALGYNNWATQEKAGRWTWDATSFPVQSTCSDWNSHRFFMEQNHRIDWKRPLRSLGQPLA